MKVHVESGTSNLLTKKVLVDGLIVCWTFNVKNTLMRCNVSTRLHRIIITAELSYPLWAGITGGVDQDPHQKVQRDSREKKLGRAKRDTNEKGECITAENVRALVR